MLLPALAVIAVPVLIHLINMLRQRRVKWAAMEFLLASQKRHRTWVILKQLLLLLARMLAVALVVLIVAGPRITNRWGNLLGGGKTHYLFLLDDSFSMSDRWGDTSAFAQAKRVVQDVAATAASEVYPQWFTLLRFSRAGQCGGPLQADFAHEHVDAEFAKRLGEKLQTIEVSQTAAEPSPALEALAQLLSDDDQRRVVYLVSDFRARQWDKPTQLKKQLQALSDAKVELHLIDCVDASRGNLAIASLAPTAGVRTAGIEWTMEVAVQNFGSATVRNLPVHITHDGDVTTAVSIAEILPGQVAKKEFPVAFKRAGEHRVAAWLDADAVAADNFRCAVVDLPAEIPVLLVDGGPTTKDSNYMSWALAPGGDVRSGIRPRIETPRYLALQPLDPFAAVALANVDHLDKPVVRSLERFARSGGGVVFFLGERTSTDFVNEELYRDGKGLFPLPLAGPKELLVDRLEKAPDIEADNHFLFRGFAEKRNAYLSNVLVGKYLAAAEGWKPGSDSGTRVIVRLRHGAPLVVQRQFGRGRVLAFLTPAGPGWNNWAYNVTYVPMLRNLFAYVARQPTDDDSLLAGVPLQLKVDTAVNSRQVRFKRPSFGGDAAGFELAEKEYQRQLSVGNSNAKPAPGMGPGEPPVRADAGRDAWITVDAAGGPAEQPTATFTETGRPGFCTFQWTPAKGGGSTDRPHYRAVNVDTAEGDLAALLGPELAARLMPEVRYEFQPASTFQSTPGEQDQYNLSDALLYLLLLLLIGEQILAWSASYHPRRIPNHEAPG
jgi:hypothetical protein